MFVEQWTNSSLDLERMLIPKQSKMRGTHEVLSYFRALLMSLGNDAEMHVSELCEGTMPNGCCLTTLPGIKTKRHPAQMVETLLKCGFGPQTEQPVMNDGYCLRVVLQPLHGLCNVLLVLKKGWLDCHNVTNHGAFGFDACRIYWLHYWQKKGFNVFHTFRATREARMFALPRIPLPLPIPSQPCSQEENSPGLGIPSTKTT